MSESEVYRLQKRRRALKCTVGKILKNELKSPARMTNMSRISHVNPGGKLRGQTRRDHRASPARTKSAGPPPTSVEAVYLRMCHCAMQSTDQRVRIACQRTRVARDHRADSGEALVIPGDRLTTGYNNPMALLAHVREFTENLSSVVPLGR
jgi:hypothetical protein